MTVTGSIRTAAAKWQREVFHVARWRRSQANTPSDAAVVFGSQVTILRDDDRRQPFRIVGKDEADPPADRSRMCPRSAACLSRCGSVRPGSRMVPRSRLCSQIERRVTPSAERWHVKALGQGAACRALSWPVIIALRHPSGEDRLTLEREIELVQPWIEGRPPKG
jgi:hypothetical protein